MKTTDKDIVHKIDANFPGFSSMLGELKENDNTIIIKATLKN
jgi:hypothetical protein